MLAAANRQLGVELIGPLAEQPDVGFACGAIGGIESQLAFSLCRCGCVGFGEFEALALYHQGLVINWLAARETASRMLELGDAPTCLLCDALRLGARAAGGVELVGDVVRVAGHLPRSWASSAGSRSSDG